MNYGQRFMTRMARMNVNIPSQSQVALILQETGIKTIPQGKKNAKKQNGCLRMPYK